METSLVSNIVITWVAVAIIFLIVEMLTSTFYALAISVAAALVAILAYALGDQAPSIAQAVAFAAFSAFFSYFMPRWFTPKGEMRPVGLAEHVGREFVLKRIGEDYKIAIDGVDYLVDPESVTYEFQPGGRVRLVSADNGVIRVSVIAA